MPRRVAPLQVNGFEGGFNTEFNPLQIPPNISTDEVNMDLRRDASRSKRLGIRYETSNVEFESSVIVDDSKLMASQVFRWENAGGNPNKSLVVVQLGNTIEIFEDVGGEAISANPLLTRVYGAEAYDTPFDFTVVDGVLVAAVGLSNISIFEYDGTNVTLDFKALKVRDFWGVDEDNLTQPEGINIRPPAGAGVTLEHFYNLRNQTFSTPRINGNTESAIDPVNGFFSEVGAIPSNADNLNTAYYADPNDSDNRLVKRFFPENLETNSGSTSRAPQGYFIIDVLKRGVSRAQQARALENKYPILIQSFNLASSQPLLEDTTTRGASTTCSYAGRVWFAGFGAEVVEPEPNGPKLSSYVLFSRVVRSTPDIVKCFQEADPTSPDDSALVDTDGGYIKVGDAYNINRIIPSADSVLVFAENGVWRISGGDRQGFSATSYSVEKVTDKGCISGKSVVTLGKVTLYWSQDGIYSVAPNEYGVWGSQNLTLSTIQDFYLSMNFNKKTLSKGFFDSYENKVRWVYTNDLHDATISEELIFHVGFQCFTKNTTPVIPAEEVDGISFPLVYALGATEPYDISETVFNVTVDGVDVTADSEDVTITLDSRQDGTREIIYLVLTSVNGSGNPLFTFARYDNPSFYDWDEEEIEYEAYIVTGSMTGGEARLKKQSPYLNVFFKKTEDGFNNDLSPTNASSCLLSSRWNWTDNNNQKKWSTPRQAYRIGNLYFPVDTNDTYDSGETIISTRNKIRGIGHSVAFKFESEGGKNMHLHGWTFDLQANSKE